MLAKFKSLAADALTYGASSMVSQVVGFLLLPLFTRHLGPADYGVLAMLALATRFATTADLGLPRAVMRFIMLEPELRVDVIRNGVAGTVVSVLLFMALGFLLASPIGLALTGTEVVFETRLALACAATTSLASLPQALLRAARRVRAIALINVASVLVSSGISLWLVMTGDGVRGMLIGQLVGGVLAVLASVFLTRRELRPGFDASMFRTLCGYGLPLLPHRVQSMGLLLFSQWVVRHMLGLGEAGLLNVASKFAVPVTFVIGAVQKAWVPFKLEIYGSDEDPASFFRSAVTYYTAALAMLALVAAVLFPELLRWLTPESFARAAPLVPLLVLVPVARGMYFMLGTGFEVKRDTRPAPLISFAGLVVLVVTTLLTVPIWGAAAAVLSTVVAWVVMTIAVYRVAQARYPIQYDWSALIGVGGVALALGVSVHLATGPVLRAALAVGACLVYPLTVYAVLRRSPVERARMARMKAFVMDRATRKKKRKKRKQA